MRNAIPAILALLVACGSDEKPADPPAAPGTPEAPVTAVGSGENTPMTPPAAAAGSADLGTLGIKGDLPEGASVSASPVGEGVMIMGGGLGAMTILPANDLSSKTIDEAKKEAEGVKGSNLKEEPLTDGWVLLYEADGGMGKSYFVNSRRDLGGKGYVCSTTVPQAEQQAKVAAVCKSLKM